MQGVVDNATSMLVEIGAEAFGLFMVKISEQLDYRIYPSLPKHLFGFGQSLEGALKLVKEEDKFSSFVKVFPNLERAHITFTCRVL